MQRRDAKERHLLPTLLLHIGYTDILELEFPNSWPSVELVRCTNEPVGAFCRHHADHFLKFAGAPVIAVEHAPVERVYKETPGVNAQVDLGEARVGLQNGEVRTTVNAVFKLIDCDEFLQVFKLKLSDSACENRFGREVQAPFFLPWLIGGSLKCSHRSDRATQVWPLAFKSARCKDQDAGRAEVVPERVDARQRVEPELVDRDRVRVDEKTRQAGAAP